MLKRSISEKIADFKSRNSNLLTHFIASVTPATIKASVQRSPNKCQIATAIQAKLPEATRIYVRLKKRSGKAAAMADFTNDGVRYSFKLPSILIPLIKNWDKHGLKPDEPFDFKVDELVNLKDGGDGVLKRRNLGKQYLNSIREKYRKRKASGALLRKHVGVPQVRKGGYVCAA